MAARQADDIDLIIFANRANDLIRLCALQSRFGYVTIVLNIQAVFNLFRAIIHFDERAIFATFYVRKCNIVST